RSAAGGAGSGPGAVISLQPTSRPLEQPTIRSRVGRISQPFRTAAFTVFVRTGVGISPDRRRPALGESDGALPIAGSLEETRCPGFLSPSNQALAPAPFPWGMVGRSPEAQFRARRERLGLPTADDHIERPLGRAG